MSFNKYIGDFKLSFIIWCRIRVYMWRTNCQQIIIYLHLFPTTLVFTCIIPSSALCVRMENYKHIQNRWSKCRSFSKYVSKINFVVHVCMSCLHKSIERNWSQIIIIYHIIQQGWSLFNTSTFGAIWLQCADCYVIMNLKTDRNFHMLLSQLGSF